MPKACLTKGETTMDYIRWIREKVGHEKIMLNFVSGCLRDKQGKLLLQKRADKNLWGFPGGAIELEYVSGELSVGDEETVELRYFKEDEVPQLVNKQHEDFLADLKQFHGQVLIR